MGIFLPADKSLLPCRRGPKSVIRQAAWGNPNAPVCEEESREHDRGLPAICAQPAAVWVNS